MFSGGTFMINEFILSTMSSMILGDSFTTYAFTIMLMVIGTALGGGIQMFVSNRNLSDKFLLLEITLALVGAFSSIFIYYLFVSSSYLFTTYLHIVIILIGFFIGFEVPLLIRITQKYNTRLESTLSLLFGAEYIGSAIGTYIWITLLLYNFPLTESGFIISILNITLAFLTFGYYLLNKKELNSEALAKEKAELEKEIKVAEFLNEDTSYRRDVLRKLKEESSLIGKKTFLISILVVYSLLFYGYFNNRNWSISLEQRYYEDPIILSEKTKYQKVIITKNSNSGNVKLFLNNSIQFSSKDEHIYHEALLAPIMSLVKGSDVLIIGGGDGFVANSLSKYKNVNITQVDLDRELILLAKNNEVLKKLNNNVYERINIIDTDAITGSVSEKLLDNTDDSVSLITIDASLFVHSIAKNKKWDAIIIDLPDPKTPELAKLYSKFFYNNVRKRLNKKGLVVIQSTSPYYAKEVFLCIGRTLKSSGFNSVLPYHINVPSFGDWGYYIASEDNISINAMNISAHSEYLTKPLLKSMFFFGKGTLHTNDIRINSILTPVIVDMYVNNSWKNI